MRPVNVTKRVWVPYVQAQGVHPSKPAHWQSLPPEPAYFHAFGLEVNEDNHCSYSVAIVEYNDGTVDSVFVNQIQFTDRK